MRTDPTPPPPERAPLIPHQPGLDGLRGLAVVGVLLFHGGFTWMRGGFLGVSTFFTLSGFLITSLLVEERHVRGRIDLAAFWGRRFRRLLPAALVVLAAMPVYARLVASPDQLRDLRGDVFAALGYVSNWRFVWSGRDYGHLFSAPSPLQHFWSLAIEEQFYLLFPLLVAALLSAGRGRKRVLVGVLVVLAAGSLAATAAASGSTGRVYYGTDTRATELIAGALLAIALHHRALLGRAARVVAGAGLAALAATAALWVSVDQQSAWLYRGGFSGVALLSVLVIAGSLVPGPVRAVLSTRPLRALGRVSYGLYLFHWPVFLWLSAERLGLSRAPLFAVRVAVSAGLALVSLWLVEDPIRRRRLLTGWRPALVAPLSIAAVVISIVTATAVVPQPRLIFAPVSARVEAPLVETQPPALGVEAGMSARTAAAPIRVMVVGDSVAQAVGRGLERWGTDTGRAVVWNVAISGCGIARGGTVIALDGSRRPSTPGCDSWAQRWARQIGEFHPEVVVALTGSWDMVPRARPEWSGFQKLGDPEYDRWLAQEYRAATDVLTSGGARLVWLDMPCAHRDGEGDGVFDPANLERLNEVLLPGLVRAAPEVRLVDLHAWVCPQGRFVNSVGPVENARPDGVHFDDPASDVLATWLEPVLVPAPALPAALR